MPRILDGQQKDELAQFLDALYEAAGYTNQVEWAREAGVHEVTVSKGRSRSHGNQIDAYNLFRLIRAAANRAGVPATAAAVGAANEAASLASIQSRLESLAKGVAEIELTQDEILRRVSDVSRAGGGSQPPARPTRTGDSR